MKALTALTAAALMVPSLVLAQATSTSSMTSSNSVSRAHVATAFEGTVVATRKDGKICRKKTETGTRLGGHLDCRTKAEWDEMAHNARQDTELHMQRGISRTD